MDRIHVPQENKVPSFQLRLNLWYENVIQRPAIYERLKSVIQDMIHRKRIGNGNPNEKSLIESVKQVSLSHEFAIIQCHADVYLPQTRRVYLREFEKGIKVSPDFSHVMDSV